MLSFRSFLFGFLIAGGVSFAQDTTTIPISELGSLETSVPNADPSTSDEDAATTADVVVKGFLPDLQRAHMVEDAVNSAKKAEQRKAAAAAAKAEAAAKAKTHAVAKVAPASAAEKKSEAQTEKEQKTKEAADRANGIIPGKTQTAAATKKNTPDPKAQSSKASSPPAVALDDKPSITAEASKVIVEDVPTAAGGTVGLKKTVPANEAGDNSEDSGDNVTVKGRLVSLVHTAGGNLQLRVDSPTNGMVEVVITPRRGLRVPVEGSNVAVHGTRVDSGNGTLVVRANEIERTGGPVYQRGYARRVVPAVPLGPGGPLGPPYMRPYPPPYF